MFVHKLSTFGNTHCIQFLEQLTTTSLRELFNLGKPCLARLKNYKSWPNWTVWCFTQNCDILADGVLVTFSQVVVNNLQNNSTGTSKTSIPTQIIKLEFLLKSFDILITFSRQLSSCSFLQLNLLQMLQNLTIHI